GPNLRRSCTDTRRQRWAGFEFWLADPFERVDLFYSVQLIPLRDGGRASTPKSIKLSYFLYRYSPLTCHIDLRRLYKNSSVHVRIAAFQLSLRCQRFLPETL